VTTLRSGTVAVGSTVRVLWGTTMKSPSMKLFATLVVAFSLGFGTGLAQTQSGKVSFCCPRVHNRCVRNHFLRPGLPIRGRTCQSMGCGCSSSSEAPSGLRPTQGDLDATSSRTNKLQVLHPHGNSPVPGKRRTSQLDTSSALGGEYAKRRGWRNDCDPLCHLASEV